MSQQPQLHQPPVEAPQVSNIRRLAFAAMGGVAGAFTIYPLDLSKTILQDQKIIAGQPPAYRNMRDVLVKSYRTFGVRGLYRGLSANLIGIIPEKATKFFVNDWVRNHFHCDTPGQGCSIAYEVLAGATAGTTQQLFTVPMELFKIIMQTRQAGEASQSLFSLVREKVAARGLRGMFEGSAASLLRDIPFSMVYFSLYGQFKRDLANHLHTDHLNAVERLGASSAAGMIAAALATPMDVIKTRRQRYPDKYPNIATTARLILQNEKPTAFFKGLTPRIIIISPLFGVAMATYESLMAWFPN